jgi:AraC family transcriptional regulator
METGGKNSMMETISEISAPHCRVEMIQGEWPKPLETHVWKDQRIHVAMLLRSPFYRAEAHFAGVSSTYAQIGSIFMVPPDWELIGRSAGGKFRAISCVFDPEVLPEGANLGALNGMQLARSLDIGTNLTAMLMDRLIQEMAAPGFGAEALAESIGTTILLECLRQLEPAGEAEAPDRPARGLQLRHIRMIDEFLQAIEVGTPSIGEIARLCGINAHYFCRLFRTRMGQSPGRYLADWRMRRAEKLLADTDLPLKEIAHRLGFSNAANFSTAFRTERRLTPGAYRADLHSRNFHPRRN